MPNLPSHILPDFAIGDAMIGSMGTPIMGAAGCAGISPGLSSLPVSAASLIHHTALQPLQPAAMRVPPLKPGMRPSILGNSSIERNMHRVFSTDSLSRLAEVASVSSVEHDVLGLQSFQQGVHTSR